MIGDLFDSPWKILIVAVVMIVLFGSKKLPDAARSLGRSMRILKTEVGSLHADEPEPGAPPGLAPAPQLAQPRLTRPPRAISRARSTRCSSRSVTCSGRRHGHPGQRERGGPRSQHTQPS